MNLSRIIIILSHVPILATAVLAAVRFKGFTKELRIFSTYIFLSAIIQFTSLYFWFQSKNNMPLLHVYVCLEFALLGWFYAEVLRKFINAGIIAWMVILFSVFTILNSLFVQDIFSFNSNALTVESILIIILALFTFIVSLNNIVRETDSIRNKASLNWINSGLFIYHSCTLLLFFFGDRITALLSETFNLYAWTLHSFLSIVMYTCFFISLWKQSRIQV
jgi:hypothetical protein